MPNVGLTCPHCRERFELQPVAPPEPYKGQRAKNGQITPLSSFALQDLFETLHRLGPGERAVTQDIYNTYQQVAFDHARTRLLTKYAIVLGLKRYGCEPWRSKYHRGYTTPDPLPTEPLKITDKARERRDAEEYRSTVSNGGPKTPELSAEALARDEMLKKEIDELAERGISPF